MENTDIRRGLEGVVVDSSSVSKVIADKSILTYKGYDVSALAENCSFLEVAYLLWHGELPSPAELAAFKSREQELRNVSAATQQVVTLFPRSAHPMDTIRTAVSFLGTEDPEPDATSPELQLTRSMLLLAKIPTLVAADYRQRKGLKPIAPDSSLDFSENFFNMCFGKIPVKEVLEAFNVSLILYAEHGFNASTFTARVITSSMSDVYSAVTGAIGSLKGPLHGGANEAVMHTFMEIEDPARAEAWLLEALQSKRKIMGFGHRVYKKGDSRVPTMKKYFFALAESAGQSKWSEMYTSLESTMIREKNIYPNLDFPAGPAYYLMGFDINLFTPIFVISRITGWTAHIMEQAQSNRLIRPLSHYTGPAERNLPTSRD